MDVLREALSAGAIRLFQPAQHRYRPVVVAAFGEMSASWIASHPWSSWWPSIARLGTAMAWSRSSRCRNVSTSRLVADAEPALA
jgi:hypothetical protein